MAEIFEMPQASPTMEVGTILAWRKAEGATLAPQDVLAEVETDKAAMEIEIFEKGFLLKILVQAGEEVAAGTPIAIIGKAADEDIAALLAQVQARGAAPAPAAAAPAAKPRPDDPAEPVVASPPPPPAATAGAAPLTWMGRPLAPGIMEMPAVAAAEDEPEQAPSGAAVRSSPASRRAARERGLDIDRVPGTGPRGRVTVADVEGHAPMAAAAGPAAAAPATGPAAVQVRNSQMRKTIARRLVQSWQEAPSFFLTVTFDCDRLVDFRGQLKDAGLSISPNDLLVKAVALALRDVPEVNASWGEQAITRHGQVHIGIAVALEEGLITPVVRDADRKGLQALAAEVKDLATRARARKLQPEEYQGSTFTISNLGMMQVEHFTAILNPPEAAILAVGALQQVPVVRGGQLAPGWSMTVTMTCDHRVVDGALGARFLLALRRYVEHPALLAG